MSGHGKVYPKRVRKTLSLYVEFLKTGAKRLYSVRGNLWKVLDDRYFCPNRRIGIFQGSFTHRRTEIPIHAGLREAILLHECFNQRTLIPSVSKFSYLLHG